MTLQFTNKHIFFATESIWNALDYRFKYQINQLVSANPDDDYVQRIDVPVKILLDIFNAVTVQPEGAAAFINQEMLAELMPQLQSAANIEAATRETDTEPPNEAMRILLGIQQIDAANHATRDSKIQKGKLQILS